MSTPQRPPNLIALAALVLAVAALMVPLFKDAPPPPAAPVDPALAGRVRTLEDRLAAQDRRVDRLESELADAMERVQDLRGALASQGAPLPTWKERPAAPEDGTATPPKEEVGGSALTGRVLDADGGLLPEVAVAVRRVLEEDRARLDERMRVRGAAITAGWAADLKEKLGLQDAQVDKLNALVEQSRARRAALMEDLGKKDPTAVRQERNDARKAYEDGVRGILTTEQMEKYESMDRREREPPWGVPQRGPPPGP